MESISDLEDNIKNRKQISNEFEFKCVLKSTLLSAFCMQTAESLSELVDVRSDRG